MSSSQKSFIVSATNSGFSLDNLPYGAFTPKGTTSSPILGVAIGEEILNLKALEEAGFFNLKKKVFDSPTLNDFISLGNKAWQEVRTTLQDLLAIDNPRLQNHPQREKFFVAQNQVNMHLPVKVGDYTDFYSSKEHAANVGSMFRDKENPLLPNWTYLPVGYHGRASSVIISGTDIHRPKGQLSPLENGLPHFSPTKRLDFELETAFIVGKETSLGQTLSADNSEEHIFGMVLMNEWSARDIQKWEYVPLGPFVSKSFATSISPWIVPLTALKPFRTTGPKQSPVPPQYLRHESSNNHYDINLEVDLVLGEDKERHRVCSSNSKGLYWTMAQQLAHHTITGCNINIGDLMASGTISGQQAGSFGSMLELSWNCSQPLSFNKKLQRTFLEDGDTVIMSATAKNDNYKISFGEVSGTILPPKY